MFRRVLVSAIIVVLAAGVSVGLQETGTPVPLTPLGKMTGPRQSFASNSGMSNPARLVIKDQKTWRGVWKRVHSPGLKYPPLPEVNFSKEMLIVAALGRRSSGGYGVVIDKAYRVGKQIQVEVLSTSPGRGCMVTQALTEPVDIVRIPKTNLQVIFKEIQRVRDCE